MKLCIRLTLIFQKRHEVASSYAFKEPKKYASASINSCKIPQNVCFFAKISLMRISLFKSPSHHLPVQNQQ